MLGFGSLLVLEDKERYYKIRKAERQFSAVVPMMANCRLCAEKMHFQNYTQRTP